MAIKKTKLPETWEEFCKQTGRDPKILPDVSVYDDRDKKNAIANFKLPLIIRHCNGRQLNYNDSDEIKYEIWWEVIADKDQPSGLGLSYHDCDGWYTLTTCGPRFAYASVEILKHMVKYFKELFEDLYL